MNKFFCIIISILVSVSSVYADHITETDAYEIAQNFMNDTPELVNVSDNYYMYNYSNGGYVIVSASDKTDAILGYSYTGNIDNIPDNMYSVLDIYKEQIEYAEKNDLPVYKNVRKSQSQNNRENIAPMIKTQWDQGYPYNSWCPIKNGYHCLTGCVATCMAQILTYHKSQPISEIYEYLDYYEGFTSIDLDTCRINYNNICKTYTGNETYEQKSEIAGLMKLCGAMVKMAYGLDASSSNTYRIIDACTTYFDYSEDAEWICKNTYSDNETWDDDIYESLMNNCPVPYQADKPNNRGHSFICDGYENGYFHINWGWNGVSDGYFKLSNLIVGNLDYATNAFNPTAGHVAIINLHPNIIDESVYNNEDDINDDEYANLSNIEYINNNIIIYNIYGNIVYSGTDTNYINNLESGYYIVNINNTITKIYKN